MGGRDPRATRGKSIATGIICCLLLVTATSTSAATSTTADPIGDGEDSFQAAYEYDSGWDYDSAAPDNTDQDSPRQSVESEGPVGTVGYTEHGGSFYKVFMTRKDHTSAQQTCEADGGHLAVVKTEFVKNFIAALIVDIENYWIGLNDKDTEGNWMWADGTTLSSSGFANWAPFEPNNDTEQNCVQLRWQHAYKWEDVLCQSQKYFICEVEINGSCSPGHFRCGDKHGCILSWQRCDGRVDCLDGSDEKDCACLPISNGFQLNGRLTMLPNQLGHETFEEILNSSVVEVLNSSGTLENYHPDLKEFMATVIFPRCNVSKESTTHYSLSSEAENMTLCTGTQLAPCRSWCEEVLNSADDQVMDLFPPCDLFPSSKEGCWTPEPAKKGGEVCYHGNGKNYRGDLNKTASGLECIRWSEDYYPIKHPWANLDNNYCRNPTGLQRPFCINEDGSQEECDVIPCDEAVCWDRGPPNYGKRSPKKRFYHVGERVAYTCNEGYYLRSGYNPEVRCTEGGVWQHDNPTCSVDHKRRLQEEVINFHSADLAPENAHIIFNGSVEQMIDLEEKKEQLVTSVVIDFKWQDSRLKWDPKYYGGINMISVLGYGTWTPPFTVKRSADPSIALPKDVPVRVSSDGLVVWSVEALTTTICDADPFFFPADTMDCPICFSAKTAVDLTIRMDLE